MTVKWSDSTPLQIRLVSELTQLDARIDARKGEPHNIYRLGIYLEAAERVASEVANGVEFVAAFCEAFSACRDMHTVARRVGLALDVERGRWVRVEVSA